MQRLARTAAGVGSLGFVCGDRHLAANGTEFVGGQQVVGEIAVAAHRAAATSIFASQPAP